VGALLARYEDEAAALLAAVRAWRESLAAEVAVTSDAAEGVT
jgi:hypothetical protein